MNKQEAIEKACQIIRKRVRFKTAALTLPGNPQFQNDAPIIREMTRCYTESWIVPLLDAIESGDASYIKEYYHAEQGDPIGSEQINHL